MQYYWKQTDYNKYVLTNFDTMLERFNSYADLYKYCQKHNINATQV